VIPVYTIGVLHAKYLKDLPLHVVQSTRRVNVNLITKGPIFQLPLRWQIISWYKWTNQKPIKVIHFRIKRSDNFGAELRYRLIPISLQMTSFAKRQPDPAFQMLRSDVKSGHQTFHAASNPA
jgi:hypothetical protein